MSTEVATTCEHKSNKGTIIHNSAMSIIPDVYNGETGWDEWITHFDCVARINGWDDDRCLLWLQVRMTGKAQRAWECLTTEAKLSYTTAVSSLRERFEPSCHRELHAVNFQIMVKKREKLGQPLLIT